MLFYMFEEFTDTQITQLLDRIEIIQLIDNNIQYSISLSHLAEIAVGYNGETNRQKALQILKKYIDYRLHTQSAWTKIKHWLTYKFLFSDNLLDNVYYLQNIYWRISAYPYHSQISKRKILYDTMEIVDDYLVTNMIQIGCYIGISIVLIGTLLCGIQ